MRVCTHKCRHVRGVCYVYICFYYMGNKILEKRLVRWNGGRTGSGVEEVGVFIFDLKSRQVIN